MTASTRRELRSAATSTSTTAIGLIRALTDARPIKPTSTRCLSARRPNPGRGSTYRRGNSVQTTAATSNLSRGNRWAVKWGPLEEGDIAESGRLRAVLEKYDPVALMHFAAYAYVGESVQKPLDYYRNNVAGTATLLQTIIDFHLLPVVFSSSCATYGAPERVPIPEDHPQRPINPYGQSKLIVERMLMDLHAAYGLSSIALRYFHHSGAHPGAALGH